MTKSVVVVDGEDEAPPAKKKAAVKSTVPQWRKIADAMAGAPDKEPAPPAKKKAAVQSTPPQWQKIAAAMAGRRR